MDFSFLVGMGQQNPMVLGMMAAYVIEWLKRAPWFPLVQENASRLNRWFSVALAAATSAGLSFDWSGSFFSTDEHGGGTLVIGGLSVFTLWNFLAQLTTQHTVYKAAIARQQSLVLGRVRLHEREPPVSEAGPGPTYSASGTGG